MSIDAATRTVLFEVLSEAGDAGLLGGDVDQHLDHSERYLQALRRIGVDRALDLGSGAGVPGLVLAAAMDDVSWTLVDASLRRTTFLELAVARLGIAARVTVVHARAEDAARAEGLRASFSAVVARSFGPPAVTAECAAGFLRVGGVLVVSEPPGGEGERWDHDGLATLGFAAPAVSDGLCVVAMASGCPDRFPRRAGLPAKRPLFR